MAQTPLPPRVQQLADTGEAPRRWDSVWGEGQKSGLFGAGLEVRGGLGPLQGPVGSLLARSLKALAAGTWDPARPGPGTSPADSMVPSGRPWDSPSQVPISRAGLGSQVKVPCGGQGHSRQDQPLLQAGHNPEASSSACLGASVPRQGVLTHLCLLLSSSRAGALLPAQLRALGAKVGARGGLPQPAPLASCPPFPAPCPYAPHSSEGLSWQEKGHERASQEQHENAEDAYRRGGISDPDTCA